MRLGTKGRPDLVCPNLREAEDLVGHEFHDEQDIVEATAMICEMGARNVIVKTPHGCVARIRVGRAQHVYKASVAPLASIVSTVGSGDAFLAGFVSARFQKLDHAECLRQALAVGAANTQRYGAGVLDVEDVRRLPAQHDGDGGRRRLSAPRVDSRCLVEGREDAAAFGDSSGAGHALLPQALKEGHPGARPVAGAILLRRRPLGDGELRPVGDEDGVVAEAA